MVKSATRYSTKSSTIKKTLIGVLASLDSVERNVSLYNLFSTMPPILKDFAFVFTGGTYGRLFEGRPILGKPETHKNPEYHLSQKVREFMHIECGIIRLPENDEGGVILLSRLITQRAVSIMWPFFSPQTTHSLFPTNLALLRLGDQWHVKKFMNEISVKDWLNVEAERDKRLNLQQLDLSIGADFSPKGVKIIKMKKRKNSPYYELGYAPKKGPVLSTKCGPIENDKDLDDTLGKTTIALISHDEMKSRMIDFVLDHQQELAKFLRILATGTTGSLVQEAAPSIAGKVQRYHSGPKGGDIEIATEILLNRCHVVVFFVDPLHPHPHSDDIKVVFDACMINENVRMLSNESQARSWMNRVIRKT